MATSFKWLYSKTGEADREAGPNRDRQFRTCGVGFCTASARPFSAWGVG